MSTVGYRLRVCQAAEELHVHCKSVRVPMGCG